MKLFKDQIRIADFAWLINRRENRKFIVIHKNFSGIDKTFRVESYSILEVDSTKPINIKYEAMEDLIASKSLEIV
jgi:hypothetical protein